MFNWKIYSEWADAPDASGCYTLYLAHSPIYHPSPIPPGRDRNSVSYLQLSLTFSRKANDRGVHRHRQQDQAASFPAHQIQVVPRALRVPVVLSPHCKVLPRGNQTRKHSRRERRIDWQQQGMARHTNRLRPRSTATWRSSRSWTPCAWTRTGCPWWSLRPHQVGRPRLGCGSATSAGRQTTRAALKRPRCIYLGGRCGCFLSRWPCSASPTVQKQALLDVSYG